MLPDTAAKAGLPKVALRARRVHFGEFRLKREPNLIAKHFKTDSLHAPFAALLPMCVGSSECVISYSKSGPGMCTKCHGPWVFIGGLFAGTFALAFLIYSTLKQRGDPEVQAQTTGVIKIGVRHFQLAAMASSFPLQWPVQLVNMFNFMMTASGSGFLGGLGLDCQLASMISSGSPSLYFGSLIAAKGLVGLVVPALFAGLFSAFWAAYTVCWEGPKGTRAPQEGGGANSFKEQPPNTKGAYRSSLTTRIIVSVLVLAMTFHPLITRLSFSFFKCSNAVLGRSFVLADMNVQCGSLYHEDLLLWIAIPAIVLYVLGIPACAFGFLYSRSSELRESRTKEQVGFLYCDYELSHYYWELVVVLRLTAFAATSVLFADKPDVQAGLGLLILFVCILAQKGGLPYIDDTLNKVEEFGLIASWLTLYGGTLLYSPSLDMPTKAVITVAILLINILFAILLLYLLVTSRETINSLSHVKSRLTAFVPLSTRRGREDTGYIDNGIELQHAEAEAREDKVILHTNVMAPAQERRKGRAVRRPLKSQRRSNRPYSAAIARTQGGLKNDTKEAKVRVEAKRKAKVVEGESENGGQESGESGEERDWQEILDPESGHTYFFNRTTGKSQWKRPQSEIKSASTS